MGVCYRLRGEGEDRRSEEERYDEIRQPVRSQADRAEEGERFGEVDGQVHGLSDDRVQERDEYDPRPEAQAAAEVAQPRPPPLAHMPEQHHNYRGGRPGAGGDGDQAREGHRPMQSQARAGA